MTRKPYQLSRDTSYQPPLKRVESRRISVEHITPEHLRKALSEFEEVLQAVQAEFPALVSVKRDTVKGRPAMVVTFQDRKHNIYLDDMNRPAARRAHDLAGDLAEALPKDSPLRARLNAVDVAISEMTAGHNPGPAATR